MSAEYGTDVHPEIEIVAISSITSSVKLHSRATENTAHSDYNYGPLQIRTFKAHLKWSRVQHLFVVAPYQSTPGLPRTALNDEDVVRL